MTSSIPGWTPKTSFLLSNRTNCEGYDIIDHAFGSEFPSELMAELQSNGWLDRLTKARTKMDADLNKIFQLSLGNTFVDIYSDGMGARGDESVFVSREARNTPAFSKGHPVLHRFISCIENTAFSNLSDEFEFNQEMTSVQFARYPGDGKSGYQRHCDSGATCQREHDTANGARDSNGRILTFVYYLTPHDWDAKVDGGALRMYSCVDANIKSDEDVESSPFYWDVTPFSDRMIVFRSDCIEHQVLPSLRRERIAITVWLYGRSKMKSNNDDSNRLHPKDSIDHGLSCDMSNFPPPLPIDKSFANDGHETIFVAIPSYRDPETWPTIQSLLQTAHDPERIFIGVVWQVDTSSSEEVRLFTDEGDSLEHIKQTFTGLPFKWDMNRNFRSIMMDYRQATGPCYARFLAQTLHRGENYVLQIDSHMRFRPNWDMYLIRQLNKCAVTTSTNIDNNKPRAVLTAYPPNYDPPHGPGPNAETRGTLLVPWKFGEGDGMLRQKGRLLRTGYTFNNESCTESSNVNDNIPCLLFAAGFNFCHSSVLDDCPYDHKLHGLFFGEELSMAVRLYTHGYDLFSPPQSVCYHQWKRNSLRTRDLSDKNESDQHLFECQREVSLEVVRMQLMGTGRGLGKHRSAKQFSERLCVDFENLRLTAGCENGAQCEDAFVDDTSTNGNRLDAPDMSSVWKLVGDFMS